MSASDELSIGQRIRNERFARNWSQKMLAEKIIAILDEGDGTGDIDTAITSINRWENNKAAPSPFYREKLCRVFGKSPEAWGIVKPSYEEPSSIWNVPYLRNPCFTGREEIIIQLHDNFSKRKTIALTQPYAVSGLGGIGKTQIASEYAYRYRSEYKAVLWVIADTQEMLATQLAQTAKTLNLPEQEQDQKKRFDAVIRWLQSNTDWLLILDSADDIEMVSKFLPTLEKGHILLTTRSQAVGANIIGIQVEKMSREEGILFILRRAKIIVAGETIENASEADKKDANILYELLDGLPLALDQAGAYMEEVAVSIEKYLFRYKTRYMELLARRGRLNQGYKLSVATTWSLNFEQVEQNNPAAAELLRLFAFLHPDAIPEVMVFRCVVTFDPILKATITEKTQLDEALGELLKYSLIQRNRKTGTCSIHRLVQVILKDRMGQDAERLCAVRIIWVLMSFLPSPPGTVRESLWEALWHTYLPHALICARLIEQWEIEAEGVSDFLIQTGVYLFHHSQYEQAEPLYRCALAIDVRRLGTEHPSIAVCLNNLANVYSVQGKYEEAEPLYWHTLTIYEKVSGIEHPDTAMAYTNLANIYSEQRKYEQAELLYQRALAIYEKIGEPDDPRVGTSLNNLANLYIKQGKYMQAEPLLKRALVIFVRGLGAGHPSVAACFGNLASIYYAQGRHEEYIDLLSEWKRMGEAAEQEKNRLQREVYDTGLFIRGERVFLQVPQEPDTTKTAELKKHREKPNMQQPNSIPEEIYTFLEGLLEQVGINVDEKTKNTLINELCVQLNKFLMIKIVDYLPEDELDGFVELMKTQPDQSALPQYLETHLPNAKETLITMFADFRDLYLETMQRQHH